MEENEDGEKVYKGRFVPEDGVAAFVPPTTKAAPPTQDREEGTWEWTLNPEAVSWVENDTWDEDTHHPFPNAVKKSGVRVDLSDFKVDLQRNLKGNTIDDHIRNMKRFFSMFLGPKTEHWNQLQGFKSFHSSGVLTTALSLPITDAKRGWAIKMTQALAHYLEYLLVLASRKKDRDCQDDITIIQKTFLLL